MRLAALCGLMLFTRLPAMAQTTWTVTLYTDTNSTDAKGNPGLGSGFIDNSNGACDLRYALGQTIAAGGTQMIEFSNPSSPSAAITNPCTVQLTNPLPPIEFGFGYTIGTSAHGSIAVAPSCPATAEGLPTMGENTCN
jgi:hypothetical protein